MSVERIRWYCGSADEWLIRSTCDQYRHAARLFLAPPLEEMY